MDISSFYPVVMAKDISASKEFYTQYFPFDVTFETDWYVSLKSRSDPVFELALLDLHTRLFPTALDTSLNRGSSSTSKSVMLTVSTTVYAM